ncbi:FG-GAP-like repeat-containing protein, partial [Streptomyces sp. NPDC058872]|uniref:FG-GAP-like repeat-containing protein n=1 Tax=Streptomyces sp. NPDC058872 TaxID=3346661 RepID=UPI0036C6D1DA
MTDLHRARPRTILRLRNISVALAVAASGIVGGAGSAQAADGDLASPFDIGSSWNVCQGYDGSVSHTGTSRYGLDLTGSGCDDSASGRNVRAPLGGTVSSYGASTGTLCINADDGRSIALTHIDSALTGGRVDAGQSVGAVAAPGQRGNMGVSHLHLQIWSSPGCWANGDGGMPFDSAHDARICGAPNLTADGPDGGNGTWSGTSFTAAACGTSGSGTHVRDFNGDGRTDVLWYGPGADPDAIWYGRNDRSTTFHKAADVTVNGSYTPVSGDFDGDGFKDVLWYGPGSGHDSLWYGTSVEGEFTSRSIEVSGDYVPVAGDFNGDGKDDVLWYGPGAAPDAIWYGKGDRDLNFNKGSDVGVSGTYVPVSGDFDGDGFWDVLWYGPGSANDSMWYGTSTKGHFQSTSIQVNGTYTPVVGDFNGNGTFDVLWYGPGADPDAIWYGSGDRSTTFSKAADVTVNGTYTPVNGDFDGDGFWDVLWYGPGSANDSMWYGTSTKGHFQSTSI